MEESSKTTTLVTNRLVLTSADIIDAFDRDRLHPGAIPKDAEVTITVPRGGDSAGDDLHIDDCGGVVITWLSSY